MFSPPELIMTPIPRPSALVLALAFSLGLCLLGALAGPSQAIVATGHGYADPRFQHPRAARFARAQSRARRDRIGLWQAVTDADLPHYYRGKLKLPDR